MINSIRASGPTGRRTKGAFAVESLGEPGCEAVRRLGAVLHRRAATLVHGAVVTGVRSVEVAAVRRSRVGDDVGVVRAGHQDRDADAERGDFTGHGFAPPFERTLDSGIRCGGRHSAHSAGARDEHNAAPTRRPHRRQKRLGQCHRAEDVGCEHSLPQAHRRFFDHSGRRDTRVVYQPVWRSDRLDDRFRRILDRGRVGEVQPHADQPRVVGTRPGRLAQLLHARVNRSHGRDNTPPPLVQVRRRSQPEPP